MIITKESNLRDWQWIHNVFYDIYWHDIRTNGGWDEGYDKKAKVYIHSRHHKAACKEITERLGIKVRNIGSAALVNPIADAEFHVIDKDKFMRAKLSK